MRKNILLFGHSYSTQFLDISNQYTQLFDKDKFHVTVVYLIDPPSETARQKHLADEVIFLNEPKKSRRGLKISVIKKLLKLCKEKKFEMVICQRYKPTYIMLWVAKFVKIPQMFCVMHELGTMSQLSRKIIVALLAPKNMIFAGVSNAVRDNLRKNIWRVPNDRVVTLYNTIDVEGTEERFLGREEARSVILANAGISSFVFGNIGRLAINKDQSTLLRAFAQIKPNCPDAKLIILGSGVLEEKLKNLATELKIQNDVIFTGYIEDGFRFMPAFDVLVSSSIQEAFGRVLLEAMTAKVPIIATAVNGVPEVIDDSSILIPPKNVDVMAKEMLKAYQTSANERERWGAVEYARVKKEFSHERFKEMFWETLYK
jgi:glycosyltransferase involved in cell wall biosynthesis